MSEVAEPTSKYWNKDKKKFTITRQFRDPENGQPVGPVQYFEADTLEELLEKKDAAHENASVKLYQTRKSVKLGSILEPDQEEPLEQFEPKQLSADDQVKITKMLADPKTVVEAHQILMEVSLGATPEKVRARLRDVEVKNRIEAIQYAVSEFRKERPAYVDSSSNKEKMERYMEKKNYAYTANNLKIAFDALVADDLLTVRAPEAPRAAVPETPATPVAAALPPGEVIPPPAIAAPAIPVVPAEVRPKNSSSGLGRSDSSAAPGGGTPPKAAGISIRDINKMSATEYQEKLKDPEFRKQVEELYKK